MTLTARQRLALKARIDFTTFCRVAYPPYLHAPHLALIDNVLAQVTRYIETKGTEGIGKLRIECPPRHGKSVKVARLYPAWVMGRNPDLRVILASHGATLSEGHSRYIRNTIRSAGYASIFPKVSLAADSQARDTWDLEEPNQGGLLAVGTGGSVTGRGAGLIIADDLIKSREEYESDSQRDKLWAWFTDDLSTRKEPGAAVVFIGTRWGVDDAAGRLELNEPGEWTVIKLPALAEENDPLGRKPGQALWPVRFDRAALEAQRRSMGEYSFQALYQQNPVSASGGIFKRDKFQIIDSSPANIKRRVRYWDLALSEKKSADYTVGVLLAETTDGRYIIEDVQRWQKSWQDTADGIAKVARMDGPEVEIGLEQVLFAALAVTELLKRADLHGYSIKGYEVHKDKVTRALPFSARVDAGLVYLVRRSWLFDYLDEMAAFPIGKHDDQVDGSSGAYAMLAAGRGGTIEIKPNPFYGPAVSNHRPSKFIASLPPQIGVSCLHVDHLARQLAWPDGWHFLKATFEYSSVTKPNIVAMPHVQFIRASTGMTYALCQRCQEPTSDLYPSKNFNLICSSCYEKESI